MILGYTIGLMVYFILKRNQFQLKICPVLKFVGTFRIALYRRSGYPNAEAACVTKRSCFIINYYDILLHLLGNKK